MEYINAYSESYKQLALGELARQSVRASDERVKHAISWIDWGFYIFEWLVSSFPFQKGTIVQMGPSAKRLSVTRKFALPLNHRKSIGKPKSPR
jgi:hypothetical protein